MIIAVEGMDGAGKTTVCEYVSGTRNYKMIEKPTKYFFFKDGKLENEMFSDTLEEIYNSTSLVRTAFFGLGNIVAVNKYKNENIILDRHLVSNYYWNNSEGLDVIYDSLVESCKPDLTILLYATPKTRYERLSKRNKYDIDLLDPSVFDDGMEKMLYFLNKYNMNYLVVDTENKSIEEVYKEIDNILDGIKNES